MLKKIAFFAAFAVVAAFAFSQSAEVTVKLPRNKEMVKTVKLEKTGDDCFSITIPKSEIPDNAVSVAVAPDFAFAQKGEEGYIVMSRGDLSYFNKDNGEFNGSRMCMPIAGMKTPRTAFWAHVRGMRYESEAAFSVKDGKYKFFVRCNVASTTFGAYEDFRVDFHMLKGDNADYVGMAKGYRKFLLDNGTVKTLKDRIPGHPHLAYIAKAVPVRIQYHGGKKRERKDFTPETETPVIPVLDFKKSVEFVDGFKKLGMDYVAFCSAGWQSGGYDGRFPDLFPIPEELGGEKALRDFIKHVKEIGYTVHAHTNTSDCYTCSRMWSPDITALGKDGKFQSSGYWCGGKAYQICAKNAWEKFLPEQLKKVRELGFDAPHYIDVFSATPPYLCHNPKHPANRAQMGEVQKEIAEFCKKEFGGFASEGGYDHISGQLDYINYVGSRMRGWRDVKKGEKVAGKFYHRLAEWVDEYVPLWELVYHGIILSNPDRLTQNHTLGNVRKSSSLDSGDLRCLDRDGIQDAYATLKLMEFGGRPIFYTSRFEDIPLIKKAYDEFLPVRHLQLELMEKHKFLAPDVTLTVFGNGDEIVCNYGEKPFQYKGKTVGKMSYALIKK